MILVFPGSTLTRNRCYGAVYALDGHPVASYVFCPLRWEGATLPNFIHLALDTPMMYLSFAPVEILDHLTANDKRHGVNFKNLTDPFDEAPYLYMLNPLPPNHAGHNLRQFVVPSGDIVVTSTRHGMNQKMKVHDWKTAGRNPTNLYLKGGKLFDEYAVRENAIVDHLCRLFDDKEMNDRQYVTTKLEVIKKYIPVLRGEVVLPNQRLEA